MACSAFGQRQQQLPDIMGVQRRYYSVLRESKKSFPVGVPARQMPAKHMRARAGGAQTRERRWSSTHAWQSEHQASEQVQLSQTLKKTLVAEALKKLERASPTDSATQPVVQVLVGDCNLTFENALEAVEPMQPRMIVEWRTVWTVYTTGAGQSGDVIFVKGAHAESFDLPFGYSHEDRAIRNGSHDAIGVELRVKVKSSI